MKKLITLRNKVNNGEQNYYEEYKKHETLCIKQFSYVVEMHANKYKAFFNYEDLLQEGFEAMLKAMKTYDPEKGSVFWWLNQYIKTRIQRSANTHTAIRYPLTYAREHQPRKENMPLIIDNHYTADVVIETFEVSEALKNATEQLDAFHKEIVDLFFGLESGKPGSIKKICRNMKITKEQCVEALGDALNSLKDNIKI